MANPKIKIDIDTTETVEVLRILVGLFEKAAESCAEASKSIDEVILRLENIVKLYRGDHVE